MWQAVLATCPAAHGTWALQAWARLWGADPSSSNGLAAHVIGAERPGLVVTEVVPPATWAVRGRHRFAQYHVVFRLAPDARGSALTIETYAMFPGALGRLYRALVITTGIHTLVVRMILRYVKHRAERSAAAPGGWQGRPPVGDGS